MLTARTEEIDRIIVVLAWEGHELFLHEGTDLLESPSTPRATVRFILADVDACWHWRRAQRIGARVLAPIDDREYGLRDFTILDADVSASPSDRGPDSQYCRSRPHARTIACVRLPTSSFRKIRLTCVCSLALALLTSSWLTPMPALQVAFAEVLEPVKPDAQVVNRAD